MSPLDSPPRRKPAPAPTASTPTTTVSSRPKTQQLPPGTTITTTSIKTAKRKQQKLSLHNHETEMSTGRTSDGTYLPRAGYGDRCCVHNLEGNFRVCVELCHNCSCHCSSVVAVTRGVCELRKVVAINHLRRTQCAHDKRPNGACESHFDGVVEQTTTNSFQRLKAAVHYS